MNYIDKQDLIMMLRNEVERVSEVFEMGEDEREEWAYARIKSATEVIHMLKQGRQHEEVVAAMKRMGFELLG